MIPFIEPKPVDWSLVQQNLISSFERNHFANRGPATIALETYISENVLEADVGVCAVSTGTAALNIAATHFSELKKTKMRWLVSANGFFSTILGPFNEAQVIDCSENGLLDISIIREIPSDSFDGIVFTNLFGFFSEFDEIIEYCVENNKALIFDNAASMGTLKPYYQKLSNSELNWAETISFHHTKPWGMGEGGCIIFDAKSLSAGALNSVANFGRFSNPSYRHEYNNYKISDFAAALILHRLQRSSEWAPQYAEQCSRLIRIATQLGLKPICLEANPLSTHAHLPIFFEKSVELEDLTNSFVVLQKYYEPLNKNCINAVNFFNKMISFPCHKGASQLTDGEIEAVLVGLKGLK